MRSSTITRPLIRLFATERYSQTLHIVLFVTIGKRLNGLWCDKGSFSIRQDVPIIVTSNL